MDWAAEPPALAARPADWDREGARALPPDTVAPALDTVAALASVLPPPDAVAAEIPPPPVAGVAPSDGRCSHPVPPR